MACDHLQFLRIFEFHYLDCFRVVSGFGLPSYDVGYICYRDDMSARIPFRIAHDSRELSDLHDDSKLFFHLSDQCVFCRLSVVDESSRQCVSEGRVLSLDDYDLLILSYYYSIHC